MKTVDNGSLRTKSPGRGSPYGRSRKRGPARLPGAEARVVKPKKPHLFIKQSCAFMYGVLTLSLPIELVSEANCRDHWRVKAKRVAAQRGLVKLFRKGAECVKLPVVVELARIAPKELDDDNLRSSLKAVRDGVADWFGIGDRDPRIEWHYSQSRRAPRTYGCAIVVYEKG